MVPVPRENIYAKFQIVFPASPGKFFIRTSPFPPSKDFPDGMRTELTGPETKTVVMFCRNNDPFHTGFPGGRGPLPAIECRGIENAGIFPSGAPFTVSKGIGPKMNKHIILHLLPFQLIGGR
jgi:hypothetical protein